MKVSSWTFLLGAWLVALVATLGALFIGEVMGQAPCELCWYQRIAMFPLAVILGVAAFRNDGTVSWYALPLAGAGALVSLFHNLVYFGILPEAIHQCGVGPSCTDGNMTLFGVIPLPSLALAAFLAIIVLLAPSGRRTP